ncbi:MAG: CoA transferase [Dehalococcoidia bacterium]|nr:CoA transferase [Dehalococcoidia bacterium]
MSTAGQYPLQGCRVVNFGWVFAGPYLATMLGDLGAEVIKIETRSRIDSMRLSPDNLDRDPDRDPWFHSGVRNQLSVTIDMNQPQAIPILKNLVKISDIVVENFSPKVLKQHGLDYQSLAEVNPGIIMVSLPAAGHYGPLRDAQTYGPSLTGLAGVDNLVGYYGERVLGLQQAYADVNSALHGAFAALSALYYRKRTGKGQFIDMAQLEAVISIAGEAVMEYTINGTVLGTQGNRYPTMCPHNNYRCKEEDKWVSIGIKTEEEWKNFCEAIGNPSWTKDERFADRYSRLRNQEDLDKLISEWTANYTYYEVTETLQKFGVAAAPCLDTEGRFFDPHLQERQTYLEVEHPATGVDFIANSAWRLSENPTEIRLRSPLLGEHNSYVLRDLLGMSEEDIARLEAEKVIY